MKKIDGLFDLNKIKNRLNRSIADNHQDPFSINDFVMLDIFHEKK